jgi:hypothetical protein
MFPGSVGVALGQSGRDLMLSLPPSPSPAAAGGPPAQRRRGGAWLALLWLLVAGGGAMVGAWGLAGGLGLGRTGLGNVSGG